MSPRRPELVRPLKMTKMPLAGSNPPAAANRGGGDRAGVRLNQVSLVGSNAHRSLRIVFPKPPARKSSPKFGSNEKIG